MTYNKPITVQVVPWNSSVELGKLLPKLAAIPREEVVFRFIDNNSSDDSVNLIEKHLPDADIIQLEENIGFGNAHNVGFKKCQTELVLILNPDVDLKWSGIKKLAEVFEEEKVAAAQGKLLREGKVIDSVGIDLTISLNGRELGAGEMDNGQFGEARDLVATTGACSLYRLSALRSLPEIFDETFFAYKEDVDLGWRLNGAGFKVIYQPVFVGMHARHQRSEGFVGWGLNPLNILKRLQSKRTRWSLRNWLWMIAKNATWKQLLLHGFFIDLRWLTFFAMSLLYWPLLPVWPEILRGLSKSIAKREIKR